MLITTVTRFYSLLREETVGLRCVLFVDRSMSADRKFEIRNSDVRRRATAITHLSQGWRVDILKGCNFGTVGQISEKMLERELKPFCTLC